MNTEEANKKYLSEKVDPVLEKMVTDMLIDKPSDIIGYMKTWLDTKGKSQEQKSKDSVLADNSGSDDDSEDEAGELLSKEQLAQAKQSKQARISVSAEAYGKYNLKTNYVPKVIQKSTEQRNRIKTRLSQAFMFSALDQKEQEIVIDAMEEKIIEAGEYVIKQGDTGDNLYVVDSGALDCFKKYPQNSDPTYLKTYQPGESFGELALLYNAPRAASIIAKEKCVLFALDRETFTNIVKESAIQKREKYETFLKNIEILSTVEPYEISKIAEALKPMKFKAGEYIVKEGEKGDTFFFLEEGEAIATKTLSSTKEPQIVFQYKAGDYFGELALLKEVPRQANVISTTDITVVALDRLSFKRLLGPLEDILKRNFSKYEKFAQ